MPSLKQTIQGGDVARVMSLGALAFPRIVEIVGMRSDLDGIWIDQEHCATPLETMRHMVAHARLAGLDSFARVAPTDYATVMRPMETGAGGVMVAQIRSVEQARQVTDWATYPPQGERGIFLGNVESRYGDIADVPRHLEQRNRDRLLLLQVETAEAVEHAHEIASIDHMDCLFVGPSDLAANLGVPGQMMHPKCTDALKRVADASAAAGKPWGALSPTPEHAAQCKQLGCRLFSVVSDTMSLVRGVQGMLAEFDEAIGR